MKIVLVTANRTLTTEEDDMITYLPDILCLYRAIVSTILVFLGVRPFVPILFSCALLSDVLDGYLYRHFTLPAGYQSKWKFGISPDPLADCALVTGGLCYIIYHTSHNLMLTIFLTIGFLAHEYFLGIVINQKLNGHRLGDAYVTLLTHFGCVKMLLVTIGVWHLNSPHWIGWSLGTIAIFYTLWGVIGDKTRLKRHHL